MLDVDHANFKKAESQHGHGHGHGHGTKHDSHNHDSHDGSHGGGHGRAAKQLGGHDKVLQYCNIVILYDSSDTCRRVGG